MDALAELFHPEHALWYVGPLQLFISWSAIHAITLPVLYNTHKNTSDAQEKIRQIFREKTNKTNGKIPRLGYVEYFLLALLIYCEYYQIQFKFITGLSGGLNLLYPCHVLTFFFLYIICVYEYSAYMINSSGSHNKTKNSKQPPSKKVKYFQTAIQECMFLFNLYAGYTWFGIIALVTPDTSDITSTFHYFIFWFHHIVLGLFPFYVILFSSTFLKELIVPSAFKSYFLKLGVCTAVFFFWDVQLPFSILFDLNINYMLLPPPPLPMRGQLYHWQIMPLCTFAVFLFTNLCYYLQSFFRKHIYAPS